MSMSQTGPLKAMSTDIAKALRRKLKRSETLTFAIIVAALIIVEIGVASGAISRLLLRRPSEIFVELVILLQTPSMISDIALTIQRIIITTGLSVLVGISISIVFWRKALLRRAYLPLLGALFATPIILLYPIFVVVLGRGTAAIVAISLVVGIIPIAINTTGGLVNVNRTLIKVGRSLNASPSQMIIKVVIPDAAPDIFAGIRLAFTYIVTSVVAVEFLLVANRGLGGRISNAYLRFSTTEMFVSIALVLSLVILSIALFRTVEGRIRRDVS